VVSAKLRGITADLLPFPPSVPPAYAQLAARCWAEPEQRPSAAELDAAMGRLAQQLLGRQLPPSLDGDPPHAIPHVSGGCV
jgi:hypothetical protein